MKSKIFNNQMKLIKDMFREGGMSSDISITRITGSNNNPFIITLVEGYVYNNPDPEYPGNPFYIVVSGKFLDDLSLQDILEHEKQIMKRVISNSSYKDLLNTSSIQTMYGTKENMGINHVIIEIKTKENIDIDRLYAELCKEI